MLQIGEIVPHLSQELRNSTKDVYHWKDIKDMRNMLAHHYDEHDFELMWNAVINEIPELAQFCLCQIHEYEKSQNMTIHFEDLVKNAASRKIELGSNSKKVKNKDNDKEI